MTDRIKYKTINELLEDFVGKNGWKLKEGKSQKAFKKEIKQFRNEDPGPKNLGKIYLVISNPDEDGFTKDITIDELCEYNVNFRTTNGGAWCRGDRSFLGNKFNIKRTLSKGRIFSVKLEGFSKKKIITQNINPNIVYEIQQGRCSILDISNVEVDHKNGKKDESYMNDLSKQKLEDFQPLSKAANDAKREHCKKCKDTGQRFDAKRLGYKESFTKGDFKTDNCQGCYWYDPKKFNSEISSKFIKKL